MAMPAVGAKLEAEDLPYVLGIGTNRTLKRRVAARRPSASALRADRAARLPALELLASAGSWPHHRRILAKIDVTAQGLNVRFTVTNRRDALPTCFDILLSLRR
jgi:hypothetical protein